MTPYTHSGVSKGPRAITGAEGAASAAPARRAGPPPAAGAPALRAQGSPEVCATARAQRWDPAEVLRVLVAEEVAGRELASIRIRTAPPALPPERPSTAGGLRTPTAPGRPRRRS